MPYYGSAFFRGQIETPAKSLTSLVINQDTDVIIAINNLGLHVIDPTNVVSIHTQLGHPYRVFIPGHSSWTEVRGVVLGLRQA